MPGKERERRLARERYQRNVERRRETRERTRKMSAVIGAVVAVAIVAGGASVLTLKLRGADQGSGAAASTSASSPSAASAGSDTCSYTRTPKGAGRRHATFVGLPPKKPPQKARYRATIKTNRGTIVMDLRSSQAPCAVNSFRYLAHKGYYDKTHCHRLVTTGIHILQCGDPSGTGKGGPGYTFPDENLKGAAYQRGTVAMANSGPDTNGSQFFFVYRPGGLAPKYTPFARVVKGLEIVDEIARAGTTDEGVAPRKNLAIKDIAVSKER